MDEIANFAEEIDYKEKTEIKIRINARMRNLPSWKLPLIEMVKNFINLLNRYHSQLSYVLNKIENVNIKFSKQFLSTKVDVDSQKNRIKTIIDVIESIILNDDKENVRWIEVIKRKTGNSIVRLRIAPLDISELMNEMVFDKFRTIILTSATLTITNTKNNNEFKYFFTQLGLNQTDQQKIITAKIPAPFNYRIQTILAIPTDIPEPNSKDFASIISELIFDALKISHGRAFILFTSYGLLNIVYQILESKLAELGITSLRQGQMNRFSLLQSFKKDKSSVLFATDSFWQGVDVEGEALESVIITKLPFKVPTEPITEARVEAIERMGRNAFMEYSVPQAVLKLKQGIGRLIRKKTDRGSIFILDKRIVEKFYGKIFLNSLPNSKLVYGKNKTVLEEVQIFFQNMNQNN